MADGTLPEFYVMANPAIGNRIALWDRDSRHPRDAGHPVVAVGDPAVEVVDVTIDGANPVPMKVAGTEAVMEALAPSAPTLPAKLIRVEGAELKKALEAHEARVAEREARRLALRAEAEAGAAPVSRAEAAGAEKRAAAAEARAEKAERELADMRAKAEADAKAKAGNTPTP